MGLRRGVVVLLVALLLVAGVACATSSGEVVNPSKAGTALDPSTIPIFADPTQVVSAEVGKDFSLAAPLDPQDEAVYWFLDPRPDIEYILAVASERVPDGYGQPGVSQSQLFSFTPLAPGTIQISMKQGRAMAITQDEAVTRSFTVVISPMGSGGS